MDTKEIDKETIIASSDGESHSTIKKRDSGRDKKRNSSRSRSRNRVDSKRSQKHRTKDSRSPESNSRHKRIDREEKYDKFKDKNKKDYKYDEHDRSAKSRDNREYRSKDDNRDKHHRSSRRSSSSKRRSHNTRDNRSHSPSHKYSSKSKEQSNIKTPYDRPFSKDNTPSVEIKKRIEEINKLNNIQAPISTSEPLKRNRELFMCNLPEGLSPKDVMELMNTAMIAMDANIKSGSPIVGAWMSSDQNCSFLEFRLPEEANNALKLDGISLLGNKIRIGKPRYQDETAVINSKDMFPTLTSFERDLNNPYLNRISSQATTVVTSTAMVPTTSAATSKLLISNLPLNFDQNAVYQVLRTFGKIKSIELIKDPITNKSSGNCHVEYETETATANALHYIMGMNLIGNTLYIRRSAGIMPVYSMSSTNASTDGGINMIMHGMSMSINPIGINAQNTSQNDELAKQRANNPSKVICFKNMISLKELDDEDDYDDLYDDVMEECKNYGKVILVKIPRPDSHENIQGIGKVFVEYATRDGAAFAKEHLQGKNFRGRKVDVVYIPEDLFKRNQLD